MSQLLATVALVCLSGLIWPQSRILVRLSSSSVSVKLLSVLFVASLMMAIIPQTSREFPLGSLMDVLSILGITSLTSNWLLGLIYLGVILNLGLSVTRCWRVSGGFFSAFGLTHLGLWLLLVFLALSAVDRRELTVELQPGTGFWSQAGNDQLPFEIGLDSFDLEESPPVIVLLDSLSGRILARMEFFPDKLPQPGLLMDWEVSVEKYLPFGSYSNQAGPVAVVSARRDGEPRRGWVMEGDAQGRQKVLSLTSNQALAMIPGDVQMAISGITVQVPSKEKVMARVEANRPLTIDNWRIFQAGHLRSGNSLFSVLMLVYNPWRPLVWVALVLMAIGVLRNLKT